MTFQIGTVCWLYTHVKGFWFETQNVNCCVHNRFWFASRFNFESLNSLETVVKIKQKREPHLCNSLIYSGATGNRTRDTRIFSPLQPTALKQSLSASNWLIYGLIPNSWKAISLNVRFLVYMVVYNSCLPQCGLNIK